MIFFIGRLWQYFGVIGILSVVVWAGSLVILAVGACHKRSTRHYWRALGVALAGLLLAQLNSHSINQIGQRLAAQASGTNVVGDLAEPALVLTHEDVDMRSLAYRTGGKVEREAGEKKGREVAGVLAQAEAKPRHRMMKAEDVHRANGWDKLNVFGARFAVWLALLAVVLNYLRRMNSTCDAYFPLPIAGPWLDSLYPKERLVRVDASDRDRVIDCLERTVRKGETFIYFGKDDPWPQHDGIPRLVLRGREFWPLRKIRCSADGEPFTGAYVFESAWFGRYGFTVEGVDLSRRWLVDLERFLVRRRAVRASARKTVNIVWDFDEPVPAARLAEFRFLCQETNHKLIRIWS